MESHSPGRWCSVVWERKERRNHPRKINNGCCCRKFFFPFIICGQEKDFDKTSMSDFFFYNIRLQLLNQSKSWHLPLCRCAAYPHILQKTFVFLLMNQLDITVKILSFEMRILTSTVSGRIKHSWFFLAIILVWNLNEVNQEAFSKFGYSAWRVVGAKTSWAAAAGDGFVAFPPSKTSKTNDVCVWKERVIMWVRWVGWLGSLALLSSPLSALSVQWIE